MKKISTILGVLGLACLATAQTCPTSTVVITGTKDTLTSGTDVQISSSSLLYNEAGFPALRNITYTSNGNSTISIEKYYYSANNRLDSIIGYMDDQLTARNDIYRKYQYDANGNLVKETKKLVGRAEEATNFTYSNNKLTSVSSPEFTITNVTFNSTTNNLASASANFPGFGSVTGNFTSDTKINPFSGVLGLNDDMLSYFNKNNVLTFGAFGQNALAIVYSYNAENRPVWLKRTETLIGDNILNSSITYGCLADFLTKTEDSKLSTTNQVSPNPSIDGIYNIYESLELVTARDLSGRVVAESTQQKLDLSSQKSGIYILEIKTSTGVKIAKVVKE